jgi:hypothetical protein
MYKICLIIPYFGRFPGYFSLFLETCQHNPEIHWLLMTDHQEEDEYPPNVHKIQMSFEQMQTLIQSKFQFPVVLNSPYKLCDYKCAYGYLFEEYLTGYDFWGYCDLDLIFGRFSDFISDNLLSKYDKIGHLGHFSLYRNHPEINTIFMKSLNGRVRYQEVFTTDHICVFDEWDDININELFLQNGKKVYLETIWADVYPFSDYFDLIFLDPECKRMRYFPHKGILRWENGRLFWMWRQDGEWKEQECLYAHFQKRRMEVQLRQPFPDIFYAVPDQLIEIPGEPPANAVYGFNRKRLVNRKKLKKRWGSLKYWVVEKTGPIRHLFRSFVRRTGVRR